jgi:hypothetical protein
MYYCRGRKVALEGIHSLHYWLGDFPYDFAPGNICFSVLLYLPHKEEKKESAKKTDEEDAETKEVESKEESAERECK